MHFFYIFNDYFDFIGFSFKESVFMQNFKFCGKNTVKYVHFEKSPVKNLATKYLKKNCYKSINQSINK